MIVPGFSSGARVTCPTCLVRAYGALKLGTLQGQGYPDPVTVACSYRGVPHADGRHGPFVAISEVDLDAWEPWAATCDDCGQVLDPPRASARIGRRFAGLVNGQRRLKRGGTGPYAGRPT